MTPEQFLELARVLPEPLLLVSSEGQILASNKPVGNILGLHGKELQGRTLFDLATETPKKILTYLEACASSRAMVLGSLTLLKKDGQTLVCRCQGAVIQPWSAESSALIVLRLESKAVAINNFVLLNKKIDELAKEIQRRKHVEEELSKINEKLELRVEERTTKLKETLNELQCTQTQLIQTEKMSSLGQVVAGVAHEINNPVNFIQGNLTYAKEYIKDLLKLLQLYQKYCPNPPQEIEKEIKAIELDFLVQDLTKLLNSMAVGTERIQEIVKSLRNFSRLDEAEIKQVDIHEGIDSTLMILEHRLQATNEYREIKVIKEYGQLPLVKCYPGQLNQVFMNILANAIDALQDSWSIRHLSVETQQRSLQQEEPPKVCQEKNPSDNFSLQRTSSFITSQENKGHWINDTERFQDDTPNVANASCIGKHKGLLPPRSQMTTPEIHIRTELLDNNWVAITIADNGPGINEQVRSKLFDPFFTTKPIGKGTGIGLSISYQIIVEKHGGQLSCVSVPEQGAKFVIKIPVCSHKRTTYVPTKAE